MAKIDYREYGTPGLEAHYGFIQQAYHTDLTWPTVQPLYSRLRRSDPEVSIVRNLFVTLAEPYDGKGNVGACREKSFQKNYSLSQHRPETGV
jgi:hypothetical protein